MKNFMQIALETAKKSGKDLPVGAIIVKNNEIIACAHNEQEKTTTSQPTPKSSQSAKPKKNLETGA